MNVEIEFLELAYLAVGPGIAFAVYIYYSDKWEPEPKKLVLLSFLLGALAWFPTNMYENTFQTVFGLQGILSEEYFHWWQIAFYAFFGVALAEEFCKFLFLKFLIFDNREFNEPYDGIVYGGILGCGFATFENLFYVLPLGYEAGIIRLLTAVPGHAFDGMILGYFMGKARFCPNPNRNLLAGLALVICLHGLYDFAAFSHATWAIYPIFAIVVLGMYLALKGKKILERHSRYLASTKDEFFLLKEGQSQGPLTLKDIRDYLSEGKMSLDDSLTSEGSDDEHSVREFLCSQTGAEYKGLIKIAPESQSAQQFLIFYTFTFGLYIYFWYRRNYRNVKDYKNLNLNPELRVLTFYLVTILPYFIYGAMLGVFDRPLFPPAIEIFFHLAMVTVETTLIYILLSTIRVFLADSFQFHRQFLWVVGLFFAIGVLRKLLPFAITSPWWLEIALVWMQGGVLTMAQATISRYWKDEKLRQAA